MEVTGDSLQFAKANDFFLYEILTESHFDVKCPLVERRRRFPNALARPRVRDEVRRREMSKKHVVRCAWSKQLRQ